MKLNSLKLTILCLLLIMTAGMFAQQPQMQPLPMDPKVRYGTLENGLTY